MRDEGPVRTSRTRLGTNRQTADSATSELEGVVSDYNLHVIVEVTIELVISNRSFQSPTQCHNLLMSIPINMLNISPDKKYRVGVLGATGTVGQRFLLLLADHPWFEVTRLGASKRSAGLDYDKVVQWKLSSPLPSSYCGLPVVECETSEFVGRCDLVFSGLDASVARKIEREMADAGLAVFSNAKSYRYDAHVPILLPFVNPDHLEVVRQQSSFIESGGFIVTNANCSTTGLAVALSPLRGISGGIQRVVASTLQAVSGAGYPGLPSLDILDNVIPFIDGEEEKIELEPRKILGQLCPDGGFTLSDMTISATCHRVAVTDGHTASVSVEFAQKSLSKEELAEEVTRRLATLELTREVADLPSCPKYPVIVRTEADRPQPKLDRDAGNGMTISVGRVRPCPVLDLRMTVTCHNTIIGAAGGSILNAELAVSQGYVTRRHCCN